jgi:hypothetical protein
MRQIRDSGENQPHGSRESKDFAIRNVAAATAIVGAQVIGQEEPFRNAAYCRIKQARSLL